jgi:hypothetical protein
MKPMIIKTETARAETACSDKGYYNPKVTLYANWIGYELSMQLSYRVDAHSATMNEFFHGSYEGDYEPIFEKVNAHIAGLESITDVKRNSFIAAVGRLIDQGREIGIEVDFLNPLTDMMTKLSTNIITKV